VPTCYNGEAPLRIESDAPRWGQGVPHLGHKSGVRGSHAARRQSRLAGARGPMLAYSGCEQRAIFDRPR